jgi:Leucine-rich repeat (LRR) protein/tRNA A-37 threonylcarbamoyl transferase component Bud32
VPQTTCPDRQELSAYVLGKLPEDALQRLSAHTAGCPHCQGTLHSLDGLSDSLISQIRQPRPGDTAPDQAALQRFLHQVEVAIMEPGKSAAAPTSQISQAGADLVSVQQFVQYLSDSNLFSADEVKAFLAGVQPSQRQDTRLLAQELVKQGKLTRFQAQMLCQGKTRGLVLGSYAVLDKLGQGGMGMVFKARHRRMNRLVALKVLSPAITKNPGAVKRFQREVEAAAKLDHKNIVAAYDAGEDKGVHFLVMEYVEGADLSNLVKKQGPLPVGAAVQCILQAAGGLVQAHAAGIIHRDIKPSNLLLDKKGTVKILDMGLARIEGANTAGGVAAELTQSGSIMGTCDYMAPEQALNTKHADQRADIYSLGCTLYYLLTGKAIYGGETAMEKLFAHRENPIPSLRQSRPEVPKKLEAVYQKMVAKEPKDRYQTMVQVVTALESCKAAGELTGLATAIQSAAVAARQPVAATVTDTHGDFGDMTEAPAPVGKLPHRNAKGKWKWLVAGGIVAAAAILVAFAIIKVETSQGTFIIETDDADAAVMLDKAGGVILHDKKTDRKYHLKPGKHDLKSGDYEIVVSELPAGLEFSTKSFTLKKDGEVRVKARFEKAVAAGGGKQAALQATEIDLLKLVDPKHHVVRGKWAFNDSALVGQREDATACIQIPFVPPDEYELEAIVTRVDGTTGVVLGLVGGGRQFLAVIDDYSGTVSGLALVDGKTTANNETYYRGGVLTNGKPSTIVARVQRAGVTLSCDGQMLVNWKGTLDRLSLHSAWKVPESKQLFLGAITKAMRFDKLVLRPLGTKGVDDAWIKAVQAMSPEKQADAVAQKLRELNPGFDGKVEPKIEDGKVKRFRLVSDHVADISPVAALRELNDLGCCGSGMDKGSLVDLSPLRGLRLACLDCGYNPRLKDLSPLQGMPLKELCVGNTAVADLTPLQGLPLTMVICDVRSDADAEILRALAAKSLITIKDLPAAEFFKQYDLKNAAFAQWLKETQKLPAQKQADAVAKKLRELNPSFDGMVTPTIENGAVVRLRLLTDHVSDLRPVQALAQLEWLEAFGGDRGKGKLSDLAPLRGMRLKVLNASQNRIRDLSPLHGMPLEQLWIYRNPIADLSPLTNAPLTNLQLGETDVADLGALKNMALQKLWIHETKVTDFGVLKSMPLTDLVLDIPRDQKNEVLSLLRSLYTLETIKARPVIDFWKDLDPKHAALLLWIEDTKKLPVEKQVEAVAKKLVELNPGFDGKVTHKIEKGVVTELDLSAAGVTDISPVRALSGLRTFRCHLLLAVGGAAPPQRSAFSDLSPLAGMRLRDLNVNGTSVADLSPLKGMRLELLAIHHTRASDFGPLAGMPLRQLWCNSTGVRDLTPLRGAQLTWLDAGNNPIADLSPLKGMPLERLSFDNSQVTDLSVVRDMPLTQIWCPYDPWRDATLLRGIKTLQKINGQPVADFWKQHDAKYAAFDQWIKDTQKLPPEKQVEAVAAKLKEFNPNFDLKLTPTYEGAVVSGLKLLTEDVSDIRPLQALPGLTTLYCGGGPHWGKGKLADLTPLRGLKLKRLEAANNPKLQDLSPLADMPMTFLDLTGTGVVDLSPLKNCPLDLLNCSATTVHDLTPLRGIRLKYVYLDGTRVADLSPLKDAPLKIVWCHGTQVSDLSPLAGKPIWDLHCAKAKVTDLSTVRTMPLKILTCDFDAKRDTEMLRGIKTLEKINGQPVAEFWKEVDVKEK